MHLFLEGPVKTGKSTLIRECIAPFIQQVGGFSSQRLWYNQKPCGYRLVPPDDLRLDAPYSPDLEGIFTGHVNGISLKNPGVFETLGLRLLAEAPQKPLILLDEIGGSELLVPAFREKLYQILEGPVPCIGVLKLASKANFMSRTAGYSGDVLVYNQQLRQDLSQQKETRILAFTQQDRCQVQEEVLQFLERIFHHVGNV